MTLESLLSALESMLKGLIQTFGGQIVVISIIYILIWKIFAPKLTRYRIQTTRRAGWSQIRDELKNIFLVVLFGVFTAPLVTFAHKQGWTTIYTDLSKYGIPYFIVSIIVILLISDIWFYWTHRLMHHPKVYRYIHAVHHESLDTTPYTSLSFHYLEPIALSAWIYIVIFLFPISIPAIGVVQVLGLLNNIKSHLGYEFSPKWFDRTFLRYIVNSTHHNLHHTRYNGNYGLFFTFWDKWWGTEFENQESYTQEVKNRTGKTNIIDNSTYQPLTISKIVHETNDVCSLYFEPSDPRFYTYKPGQYINLKIHIHGRVYKRIFSLSSAPVEDRFLRITVKKHGPVTTYFHTDAKVGDTISALYPVGDFTVDTGSKKKYLMIAGGSGITPIYSMIRSLLTTNPNMQIVLLYANRDEANIIFKNELSRLEKKHSSFVIKNFISGKNRIAENDILTHIDTDTEIRVCGPESLKKAVKGYIKSSEKNHMIETEDFADGFTSIFTVLRSRLFS